MTDVRLAAEALMRHGDYDGESPDAIEWLRMEAGEVAHLASEYRDAVEVVALLADTGWWDPSTEPADRALRVATDLGLTANADAGAPEPPEAE